VNTPKSKKLFSRPAQKYQPEEQTRNGGKIQPFSSTPEDSARKKSMLLHPSNFTKPRSTPSDFSSKSDFLTTKPLNRRHD